jgi:ADP-heptose:LPS heptosyltransferase
MGDVALLTPVIRAMREQYPEVEMIILTRPAFTPFFTGISGIRIITPDFEGRHKGLAGIFRLFKEINDTGVIDHVLDLHDVMRSVMLRSLFKIKRIPVSVIEKGRREKQKIVSGKSRLKLPHAVERYMNVFSDAGFDVKPWSEPSILTDTESGKRAKEIIGDSSVMNIGVAPYAKHILKMWPEDYMIRMLDMIAGKYKVHFWLFGGKDEKRRLEDFVKKVPHSTSLCDKLSLNEELAVIKDLDLMIAMDSSNMHMASLTGTKVISIWGGTDPAAGFGAWMQPENFSIRIDADELTCRPCTIFGKGECKRGDLACMMWLTPEKVIDKIEETGVFKK